MGCEFGPIRGYKFSEIRCTVSHTFFGHKQVRKEHHAAKSAGTLPAQQAYKDKVLKLVTKLVGS